MSRRERAHRSVFDDPQVVAGYRAWRGLSPIEERAISSVLTPESHVLEVGVGTGRVAEEIAPRCASYTGVECSILMLREASAAAACDRLIGGDILEIDPGMARFDIVLCMHNVVDEFHPRRRREALFERLHSWLMPTGCVIYSSHLPFARRPRATQLAQRLRDRLIHTRGWAYVPERYHGHTVWQYRSKPEAEQELMTAWGFIIDHTWEDDSRWPPDWAYYRAHRSLRSH